MFGRLLSSKCTVLLLYINNAMISCILHFALSYPYQDPRDGILEECREGHHCEALKEELAVCTDRVSSRSKTEETCTQELFDFIHCVDHCVSIQVKFVYYNESLSGWGTFKQA